ncbi:MAG: divalent-cation tolerance protein CutA [Pseudomonadota bacterium]
MTAEPHEGALIVFTSLPSREAAAQLAQALVERRLAACVNMLAECTSVYRWQGVIETTREVPLLIKTRAALYEAVEAAIRELHPYELPEIVAVTVQRGLPGYLDWVSSETASSIG